MMSKLNIKKKIFFGVLSFILCLIIIFGFLYFKIFVFDKVGTVIEVKSKTTMPVNGLKITYSNIPYDIPIPENINTETYYLYLNPLEEEIGEGPLKIYYFDKNNNRHEIILLDRFVKDYNGVVNVTVESVDEQGIFNITVCTKKW